MGETEEAALWDVDEFTFVERDTAREPHNRRPPSCDLISDRLRGAYTVREHWRYCLGESAYHLIGNNYTLTPWLFNQWLDVPVDFAPTYELWRADGEYFFDDGVCQVFQRR